MEATAERSARRAAVLVVDDDHFTTTLVKALLESESDALNVRVVNESREALKLLGLADGAQPRERYLPDLIVLDLVMPEVNGFEMLRRLRGSALTKHIPIIMVTGSEKNIDELVRQDVDALLRKPLDNRQFVAAVEGLLHCGLRPPERPTPRARAAEAVKPEALAELALSMDVDDYARRAVGSSEALSVLISCGDEGFAAEVDHLSVVQSSPLVRLVEQLLDDAVTSGASDVHIEPQEDALIVRLRHEGALRVIAKLPTALAKKVSARVKILAGLDIAEKRVPQDGRFRKAAPTGEHVEFRVNTLPGIHGEKIVLRVLRSIALNVGWEKLAMSPADRRVIESVLMSSQGMVLATGPTGSGKTTTLYSMLSTLNTPERNITTVEDPVEYEMRGINQVSINSDVGLTFDSVLRSLLRQDPNVILVGEMRDRETAEIGMRAAMTGHLVLSTLHTNSAAATVTRLINMGVEPFMIAAALRVIVAQRLVRLLCPKCKLPTTLSPHEEQFLSKEGFSLGEGSGAQPPRLYAAAPRGCPSCRGTGYHGRKAVYEVLSVGSPAMRKLILEGDEDALARLACQEGMTPIARGALELIAAGLTSPREGFKYLLGH